MWETKRKEPRVGTTTEICGSCGLPLKRSKPFINMKEALLYYADTEGYIIKLFDNGNIKLIKSDQEVN